MPDGTSIPVCNYNVLFKETDPKFNPRPQSWGKRGGGQTHFNWPQPAPENL